MKKCPSCNKLLILVSEGLVAHMKEGQSIFEAQPYRKWQTYTCNNKNCSYYHKKLVWDELQAKWTKLPKP